MGLRNWNFTEVTANLEANDEIVLSLDVPDLADGLVEAKLRLVGVDGRTHRGLVQFVVRAGLVDSCRVGRLLVRMSTSSHRQ